MDEIIGNKFFPRFSNSYYWYVLGTNLPFRSDSQSTRSCPLLSAQHFRRGGTWLWAGSAVSRDRDCDLWCRRGQHLPYWRGNPVARPIFWETRDKAVKINGYVVIDSSDCIVDTSVLIGFDHTDHEVGIVVVLGGVVRGNCKCLSVNILVFSEFSNRFQ